MIFIFFNIFRHPIAFSADYWLSNATRRQIERSGYSLFAKFKSL